MRRLRNFILLLLAFWALIAALLVGNFALVNWLTLSTCDPDAAAPNHAAAWPARAAAAHGAVSAALNRADSA
jgi:hypothetical protein